MAIKVDDNLIELVSSLQNNLSPDDQTFDIIRKLLLPKIQNNISRIVNFSNIPQNAEYFIVAPSSQELFEIIQIEDWLENVVTIEDLDNVVSAYDNCFIYDVTKEVKQYENSLWELNLEK